MTGHSHLDGHTRTALQIEIENATLRLLRAEAARRDTTLQSLTQRLLDTIAVEKLTQAVLDD